MAKLASTFAVMLIVSAAHAQWDPNNGQYGKTSSTDFRMMTYNVRDTICSTSDTKVEGLNDWCSLARIVAAMKPDVLILQETADNSGNGTGSGVDSVSTLNTVIGLFLHGGNDPFKAGNPAVTAYVQKYDAAYDLPFVFVSNNHDGFNRNVILSRYGFADLNGDTKSQYSDIPSVTADQYAPGGNGGIRGFMFGEIDLPSASYAGNIVIGCAHLKSGSAGSDHTERVTAAANVAYVIDYWYNGAGGSTPDPNGKIFDVPLATSVLAANTPVAIGGDWNEDELLNGGTKGPAEWLSAANTVGGTDGTDRDRTDSTYDDARNPFDNNRKTFISGSNKYDYIAWQDSIATLRRAFVFNTSSRTNAQLPPELQNFQSASSLASDHLTVIADLILPASCGGPSISSHPASQAVCSGGSVTFTVTASGDPPLSYQWRKGGVNIGGATSSTYTINPVATGDAGNYDVVVSNTCSSVTSNAATLTVNTAPSISSDPSSQLVCSGSIATFSVTATGSVPLGYQWRKNGVNIGGATSSNYTINPAAPGDAADYDCVVNNSCGSDISNLATLSVVVGPSITQQPSSQSVCAGGSATFTVSANSGGGTLTYQWRKNGFNIGGATSSSYTINPVTTGDAANYTVLVSNQCAGLLSSIAVLTVNSAPSISVHPASQTVNAGDSVLFSVTASGTAPLSYQWRKGGVNISGATSSSYAINPVAAGDAGVYDVVVTNACGSVDSNDATLTVNVSCVACDTNCDGSVNPFDINSFLDVLGPSPNPCSPCAGDANGDGTVNPFDINAFLACLNP